MIFDTKDSLKDIPSSTNGNRWRSSFMISNRAKFIHNDFLFTCKKKSQPARRATKLHSLADPSKLDSYKNCIKNYKS